MSKSIEIKLNYAGIGQLLKSSEMQSILAAHASRIAGDGSSEVYVSGTRAVGVAKSDKLDNSMLRAIKS